MAGWTWADGKPIMATDPVPDGGAPVAGTELDLPHPRSDSWSVATVGDLQASPSGEVIYLPWTDSITREGRHFTGGTLLRFSTRSAVAAARSDGKFSSPPAFLCGESLLVDGELEDAEPAQRISTDGVSTALRSPVRAATMSSAPVCGTSGDTVVYQLPSTAERRLARFVVARFPGS